MQEPQPIVDAPDTSSASTLPGRLNRRQFIKAAGTAAGITMGGVTAISLSGFGNIHAHAAPLEITSPSYTVSSRLAWWYQARFGMFIHFGSYSYLGHGEWAFANEGWSKSAYQTQVSANFNPTNFDAAAIVGLAKAAGMKYLVITSKHHEGFAMWNSNVQGFKDYTGTKLYNLYNYTAYKSDLLGALKSECAKQGIQFGLYYSILDWNHSSQNISTINGTTYSTMTSMTARANYITDMKAHLQELITIYDPAILWFDGDWCANPASPTLTDWWIESDGVDLYNYLLGLKPALIVNERVKRGFGLGDWDCPEQTVPAAPLNRPWETCETMNSAWGYNISAESSYKSSASLIQEMVKVVSRDGNFLLNIGPKGDGTATSGSVTITNGFNIWMSTYSDSIYGATASPYVSEPSWGFYTKKSGKLYVHVLTWPTTGTLQIPGLANTINRIYLLNNTATSLNSSISGGNITISIPTSAPNSVDSVIVVEVSGTPTAGSTLTGYCKIVSRNSGLVLDVPGASTANGALIEQWTDNGAVNQQWSLVSVSSGYYKIVSRNSGLVLDVTGASTANGALIEQWPDNGGTNQQWSLVQVS